MKNIRISLVFNCLLAIFILFSFSVSAQDSSRNGANGEEIDYVAVYVDKHPDGILSKLYNLHADDKGLANFIKNEYLLINRQEFPDMTEKEIASMQKESDFINQNFKEIVKLLEQGNSFDRAKLHVLHNLENAKIQKNNDAPTFMAAPAQSK